LASVGTHENNTAGTSLYLLRAPPTALLLAYLPVAVPSATSVASAETTNPTEGTAEVVAAPAETTRGTATEAIARSGLNGPTLRRRKAP